MGSLGLNPLSSIEACIIPVLMYGSESWILNSSLLATLKSFQSEIGKRTLIINIIIDIEMFQTASSSCSSDFCSASLGREGGGGGREGGGRGRRGEGGRGGGREGGRGGW